MPVITRRAASIAALALLAACSTPRLPPPLDPAATGRDATAGGEFPTQVQVEHPGMTCRAATAAARTALKRMGYVVESVLPPSPEQTGEIRAQRHTGWYTGDAGNAYAVAVRLTCDDRGAIIAAASEEPLRRRLAFKRDFPTEISRAVHRRGQQQPKAPSRQPPAKLRVSIVPLGGGEAAELIGGSPEALGVTPVRVAITNHTDLLYRFVANRLQLLSEEGNRERPMTIGQVVERLPAEWHGQVRSDQLVDTDVPAGATVTGYVFVPAAAYRRAKVVLIEAESEEAEGFSVEF